MKDLKTIQKISKLAQANSEQLKAENLKTRREILNDDIEKAAKRGDSSIKITFVDKESLDLLEPFFKELSDNGFKIEKINSSLFHYVKISWD